MKARLFGLICLVAVLSLSTAQRSAMGSWDSPQTWLLNLVGGNLDTTSTTQIHFGQKNIPSAPPVQWYGNGGEFTISSNWTENGNRRSDGTGPNQFYTFCIQENVTIGWGRHNFDLSFTVKGTPAPPGNATSVLMARTSALYREFLNVKGKGSTSFFGETVTYDTGGGSGSTQSNLLQKAIWHTQGFSMYTDEATASNENVYVKAVNNYFTSNGLAFGLFASNISSQSIAVRQRIEGVLSLNFFDANGSNRQSQLVYITDAGSIIPEPMTASLFGLGCVCFVGLFRRRSASV